MCRQSVLGVLARPLNLQTVVTTPSVTPSSVRAMASLKNKPLKKPVASSVETTKEALLRVVIDSLNASGEVNLRLEAILEEVGVSPSSLYHHYGSMNGLIEAAQVERFRRANLGNAQELKRRVETAETLEEFTAVVDEMLDTFLNVKRAIFRMQRASALGSAYGRPDLMEALGHSQRDALEIGAEALNIAKNKGFIRKNLDSTAFVAWFDSQAFGRVLVEITQDKKLGKEWSALARQSVHALLFGTSPY